MMKIEAIIKPFKFDEVRDALVELNVSDITITEVKRLDEASIRRVQGGSFGVCSKVPKLKLDIVVEEDKVEEVVDTIDRVADHNGDGDGRILVLQIERVRKVGSLRDRPFKGIR